MRRWSNCSAGAPKSNFDGARDPDADLDERDERGERAEPVASGSGATATTQRARDRQAGSGSSSASARVIAPTRKTTARTASPPASASA